MKSDSGVLGKEIILGFVGKTFANVSGRQWVKHEQAHLEILDLAKEGQSQVGYECQKQIL